MQSRQPVDPEFEALIHHIQEHRGLDFRGYKRSSLQRRVALRMQEVGAEDFSTYQAFLEVHPQEYVELLNTVLINVTSFFRDKEAWDTLREEAVPAILARCGEHDPIRIWSAGCASGEEPYSLAMLFAEALGIRQFCRRVKIYATDLDEAALLTARHATYAPREVENVPPDLLERYFERTNNHYVFQRELRKCVIFGRHNIVHDAPISRIDLLLCRNLLIYLENETQNVVLPRLHYALKDEGLLFLGKAETQLARSKIFKPVNTRYRLFQKVPQGWRRTQGGGLAFGGASRSDPSAFQARLLEAIVDGAGTAYIVVNDAGDMVFTNAAARRMLEVGEGDVGRPFRDLSISYRPAELRSRMEEARQEGRPIRIEHQEYHRPPAEPVRLTIEIAPLMSRDGTPYATLLSFSDTTRVHSLQRELEAAQESLETTIEELQSANEELETTNEELQSTNEELETTNEELQSTNEELETMNEELRSTNEELEATNEELRLYSEQAVEFRSYSDSILRSVDFGIVILNEDMTIRSWNRWCENMWGLRAEEVTDHHLGELDIGLPAQLLEEDLSAVLTGKRPFAERALNGVDRRGRHLKCRVRISPLLAQERRPKGCVLAMEDVSEDARRESRSQYLGRVLSRSLNEIYFLHPETLRFALVNQGAERKLGYGMPQLSQMTLADVMPEVPLEVLKATVQPLLDQGKEEVVFEAVIRGHDCRDYPAEICLQYFAAESPPILVAIVHDITDRQRIGGLAGDRK
jgi:two-component system, chemotaxis family, CheB/CheR fusion protein